MPTLLIYVLAIFVLIHGLIHLMGFVAYWPLTQMTELPYKTALLSGRWDVGDSGMRAFSVLWLAAAVGFALAALGLALGQNWFETLILAVLLLSLVITVLDWEVAFRGAIIDGLILIALLLGPSIATLLYG